MSDPAEKPFTVAEWLLLAQIAVAAGARAVARGESAAPYDALSEKCDARAIALAQGRVMP